jgi:hypothetical protein
MTAPWPVILLVYVAIFLWLFIPNIKNSSFGCLLMALFFPVTIPAWLIALGVWHYFFIEFQLRRNMKRAGRLLPRGEVPEYGTIIIDSAAFNHYRERVWWTPDDISTLSPIPVRQVPAGLLPEEMLEPGQNKDEYHWPPFDRWVWENYLNPETGRAKLSHSILRHIDLQAVKRQFSACEVIATFSAGQEMEVFRRRPSGPRK